MSTFSSIPGQRKHCLLLIQTIRSSFSAHKGADSLLDDANKAYDELKVNPMLRNILMSIPPAAEPAVKMDSITSFYFSNESHEIIAKEDQGLSISKRTIRKRKRMQKIHDILRSIFACDEAIASFYKQQFQLCHQYGLFGKITFFAAILGNDFDDLGETNLSMQTIFSRLHKTEEAMGSNVDINFKDASLLGQLWRRSSHADRLPSLKLISSEFPAHLNSIAKLQYLDVILNIHVPGVVSPDKQQTPVGTSDPVTCVNLLSSNKTLLGSVLVWNEFISPEFKEGYYKKGGFKSVEWLREPK
jgi:hypothetical protein